MYICGICQDAGDVLDARRTHVCFSPTSMPSNGHNLKGHVVSLLDSCILALCLWGRAVKSFTKMEHSHVGSHLFSRLSSAFATSDAICSCASAQTVPPKGISNTRLALVHRCLYLEFYTSCSSLACSLSETRGAPSTP